MSGVAELYQIKKSKIFGTQVKYAVPLPDDEELEPFSEWIYQVIQKAQYIEDIGPFWGASEDEDGWEGFVPAPEAGDQDKVLHGDGTWRTLPSAAVTSVNGYTGDVELDASDVGADAEGSADAAVEAHDEDPDAHEALFSEKQDAITAQNKVPYAYIADTPTVLPNPYPLTFGNKSYDGASAQSLSPSDIGLGTVFNLKGSKASVSDLPASGNVIGDVWYVIAEHVGYVWLNDGTTRWEQLGLPVDLSNYTLKNGTYPDMSVGHASEADDADHADTADIADNLGAVKDVTVSTPFSFRASGGGADIDGDIDARAEIMEIYGNTVVESGSLVSFTGTGIRTVGFNQWDERWENGSFRYNSTLTDPDYERIKQDDDACIRSADIVRVIPGAKYYIRSGRKVNVRIAFFGMNKTLMAASTSISVYDREFTVPADAHYLAFYQRRSGQTPAEYDGDITINLAWSGYRNGEYEPHWTETKALPTLTYFPDGMKSAGTVRDELTRDRAVKRCGTRAYQTGDEEDDSVVTDGTNTVYALAEPIETPIDPPLDLTYRSSDYGTELLLPETGTAPMSADIDYVQNLRDKLQRMPMSPDTPGDYIVHYDGVNQSYKKSGVTITGITAAGTPLTPVDGVVDIPATGRNILGLVKTSESYGISFFTGGTLQIKMAPQINIDERNTLPTSIYRTITAGNLDYAVKAAMTDGIGVAWTDAEKAGAWLRLNSIKTTMDAVAVAGARYYLGTQSAVTISMPTDALVGQEIVVFFKSGSTATTLVCDLDGFSLVPAANKSYMLTFALVHKADPDDDTDEDEWTYEVEAS